MYLVNSPLQGQLQISLRSNGDTREIYEHSQELSTGHSKFAANTSNYLVKHLSGANTFTYN
jgi:hypothetical protein